MIKDYTSGPHTDIVLRMGRKTQVHLTVRDMQQLITYGEPIFHDLLTLSLEVITSQYGGKYLEPAFFSQL
jgi:hypothetical protein